MDTGAAAQRWADVWQRAWKVGDVEAIVALYAEDAIFSSEPYWAPYRGREGVRTYVAGAFAEETMSAPGSAGRSSPASGPPCSGGPR